MSGLFVSAGDPTGISPEILIQLLPRFESLSYPTVLFHTGGFDIPQPFAEVAKHTSFVGSKAKPNFYDKLTVVEVYDESNSVRSYVERNRDRAPEGMLGLESLGKPSITSGYLAAKALQLSTQWIKELGTAGLLTLPLSKEFVSASGYFERFSGHTGYLAEQFDSEVLMLLHGQNVSVIPLTVHIPLAKVPEQLKLEMENPHLVRLLKKVMEMKDFRGQKAAMLGLNPHAGEGGYLGNEEVSVIAPKLKDWSENGLQIDGPLSADGAFFEGVRDRYRLFLGCYHDQVLIPFKALEGRRGINVSVGLPFWRVSPDHGTGFSIAGKGIASADSANAALDFLIEHG